MVAIAAALFGLIVLLAALQYRWLGQISDAERDRMKATLNARASAFALDVDRELTRAYLLFQVDQPPGDDDVVARVGARYDRWQATARFPRLIKEVDVVDSRDDRLQLRRFDPSSRAVVPIEWPAALSDIRTQMQRQTATYERGPSTMIVRTLPAPVAESVPALIVPTPVLITDAHRSAPDVRIQPSFSFTILLLDADYLRAEMLPALAQQHFRGTGEAVDYQVAIVKSGGGNVYHSSPDFAPAADAAADAAAELFQVRTQDFGTLAAEVQRFTTFVSTVARGEALVRKDRPMQFVVEQRGAPGAPRSPMEIGATPAARTALSMQPHWRLLVKHPSGSLERAIGAARRRNLLVSGSILAILAVSVALLVVSTRRAQELARRQMEFVAAVSHELRTPLAVIRSAGDNLADGVVHDQVQVQTYGELVRGEGRRLTEMVEQILEFAGIQSGQRGFAFRPLALRALVDEVVASCQTLIDEARVCVEVEVAEDVPLVVGDEAALRRAVQNVIGNAIKYSARGGWIGISARVIDREIQLAVTDRGIGIDASEHARIFEPFYRAPEAIAAQIQGAGLGLSLVQRIVEAHGGRVTVESARGSGSTFVLHLPTANETVARVAPDAQPTPAADHS